MATDDKIKSTLGGEQGFTDFLVKHFFHYSVLPSKRFEFISFSTVKEHCLEANLDYFTTSAGSGSAAAAAFSSQRQRTLTTNICAESVIASVAL